jgi:modulator of FtsH protease HflC
MKAIRYILIVVVLVASIIVLLSSAFVVQETDQVVITQFGKPVGKAITTPGLHFKTPFIQKAIYFDKRFLEWDGDPNQIPTKDKKFIFIDTYARWQITDPLQFFKRMTNERGAQSRLDDIIDGETRDIIANHNIEEAVRTSNRTPISSGASSDMVGDTLIDIQTGREALQKLILKSSNDKAKDLGIVILDVRIKRINYVAEVQNQVYERMKSERFRIAEKFRSEGLGEASRINGEKERELKVIQSEAFKEAEKIKGDADAKAAAIYASAYNRNADSRELYSFLKSLETFEKTFDAQTSVVLSTNSELYKYLKSMK